MGLFSNSQQNAAENVYARMRPYLAGKDGKVHIVMVNSFSKLGNQNFDCDTKYTTEIDSVLSGQGMTGNRTGFNTVITYK